jgi:hypothetical protein
LPYKLSSMELMYVISRCRYSDFRRRRGGLANVDIVCGPPWLGRASPSQPMPILSDDVRDLF